MGKVVTLVRPDGSLIQVDASDADTLQALDYRQESAGEAAARNAAAGREDYYTSAGQRLKTVGEGLASGLSLGTSDVVEQALGWDAPERAAYNPGTRLGSEIVGALAPAILTDGASLAAEGAEGVGLGARLLGSTPSGLLAKGAAGISEGLADSRAARAVIRGAVEGAGYGGAAQVTTSALTGDPLTTESVLAGMGWGAVWGGGLSYGLDRVGAAAEGYAARRAATAAEEAAGEVPGLAIPEESWGAFRGSVDNARKAAGEAVDTAKAAAKAARAPESLDDTIERVTQSLESVETAQKDFLNEVSAQGKAPVKGVRELREDALKTLRRATVAASGGEFQKFETLLQEHSQKLGEIAKLTGVTAPELEPFVLKAAKDSQAALKEVNGLSAIRDALDKFPVTADGFAATTPAKMERHVAALNHLLSGAGGAELQGVRDAVTNTIQKMADGLGLSVEGKPAEQLRAIWEAARASKSAAGQRVTGGLAGRLAAKATKMVGGTVAREAAEKVGAGRLMKSLAYEAGRNLTGGLLGLKGAVLGSLSDAAAKWTPKLTKAATQINAGARVDPLRTRLDGTHDEGAKTRKELMRARSEEIRNAAPAVRDTLYRAIEPLSAPHPDFAKALHEVASKQFESLTAHLPRDPGTSIARLKSTWSPDSVTTEKFARIYEVFQNPVGVALRALREGKLTSEAALALREFSPEVFQHLRLSMMDRLSQPGVLESMDYHDQVTMGRLLDLTIHSTMTPRFITAQQQMFQERTQPPQQKPQPGAPSDVGGRPPSATAAQRITDH